MKLAPYKVCFLQIYKFFLLVLALGIILSAKIQFSNMQIPLIRLQCGVNSYDWGKVGKDSAAAKFAAATPAEDFSIQSDKPYAEVHIFTYALSNRRFNDN